MTILQKYVLRELFEPLGLGLAVFTFVFLVGQLFHLTDLLLNSGASAKLTAELILSLLPSVMSITVPMALLMGLLLSTGRLAADREILAIRVTGINLFHICLPLLLFSAGLAGLLIYANHTIVPKLNLKSTDLKYQIAFDYLKALPADRPYDLEDSQGGPSTVLFFDKRDPNTGGMEGVHLRTQLADTELPGTAAVAAAKIKESKAVGKGKDTQGKDGKGKKQQSSVEAEQKFREQKVNEALVTAERGQIHLDMEARLITLELTSGSMHIADPNQQDEYTVIHFAGLAKGVSKRFGRTEEGGDYRKSAREMSSSELRSRMKQGGKKGGRFLVEYYERYSIPLACIAFALIAIPLGIYVRPTGKAIAFAISFLLILLYYGLLNYGVSLGANGNPIGVPAIFFPNVLLAVVGSCLLYRIVRK